MHRKRLKDSDFVVLCAGDSLTQATFSSNYVSILQKKLEGQNYEIINAGKVGDTAENLLKRIHNDVISKEPDFITILIGANDARQNIELDQALESYRNTIREIIFQIRSKTDIPVALISLAPLGENPFSEKNKKVEQYNIILENIASRQNLVYLPFFENLIPALKNKKPQDRSEFKLNLVSALIKSAFRKYFLKNDWDTISKRNGFTVLTDGIHLNDYSGNILAELIKEWILLTRKM